MRQCAHGGLTEREELNVTRLEASLELVGRACQVEFPSFASLGGLDVVAGLRLFGGAVARRIVLVYGHCGGKASIQRKTASVAKDAKRRARSPRQETTRTVDLLEQRERTGRRETSRCRKEK